jgi:GNAT superfamily N-acetyltransferase
MRAILQESDELRIRRGSDADLDPLVAVFRGERSFFGDCLAKQRAGGGALLVAWLDGWPVGDVFLDRGPAEEPQVRRWLPGVPRLNHLEVLGPLQRRGIGSALLRAGEATARKLGHRRVALGVGVDNPGCHQEQQQRQRSVTSPPPTHGQR